MITCLIFSTRKDTGTNHDWASPNNCCALHNHDCPTLTQPLTFGLGKGNHETICKNYYISSNLLDTQDT